MRTDWYKNVTDMSVYSKNLSEYILNQKPEERHFGYGKYKCFNNLSPKDKDLFLSKVIDEAISDLRYGQYLNEDLSSTVYSDDFELLPDSEQERRMSEYIDKVLESKNG